MGKYKGKNVLVVGFGLSGVAVTNYLAKQGARVTVTDLKQRHDLTSSLKACMNLNVEFDLGKHTPKFFHEADLIVVSPGVPLQIKPLEEAREKHVPITNEVDMAAAALNEPLVAITGTNGKTTTSYLLNAMFEADKKRCYLGGNIGKPLLDHVASKNETDVVIAELSSFQLELIDKMVPATAVFTNIGQDHLDRYPDMESYIRAKKRLLKACGKNSYVVLNYDDPIVSKFADESPGRVIWFTKNNPLKIGGPFAEQFTGTYFDASQKKIFARFTGTEEIYDLKQLKLFGEHNRENLMAAICAARMMGVQQKPIQTVIDSFAGVEHRLEIVRRKGGVFFINDSKSTNVMSVYRSLSSFRKNPIILVAGGKDKDMDFTPLRNIVEERARILILIGQAKEKINRSIGDSSETYLVGTFEEAVLLAYQKSQAGDIVLLSPGCSSQDMFRNYEERGDYFKKLVMQL